MKAENRYVTTRRKFKSLLEKDLFYYWFKYHRHFFNSLIWRGRKLWAFNCFLNIKFFLKKREEMDPFIIFIVALFKITPELLLFPKKKAGEITNIPLPIVLRKQITFANKWLTAVMRRNFKRVRVDQVVDTLIKSIYNQGDVYLKISNGYEEARTNIYLTKFFS